MIDNRLVCLGKKHIFLKKAFDKKNPFLIALANLEEDRVLHILISRQEYDLKDIKLSFRTLCKHDLEDRLSTNKMDSPTFECSDVLLKLVKDYTIN